MQQLMRAGHDQLPKISQSFQGEAEKVKHSLDGIKVEVEMIEGGDWFGEGATAFLRVMRSEVIPAMERLIQALELGSRVTRQISQIVEALESEVSQFFAGWLATISGGGFLVGIAVAGIGGMGGEASAGAEASGSGGGGGGGSAEAEQSSTGGGGGGGGGSGGGSGGGGGGGGSWNGEIGFKQEKPAPGGQPARPGRRRSGS